MLSCCAVCRQHLLHRRAQILFSQAVVHAVCCRLAHAHYQLSLSTGDSVLVVQRSAAQLVFALDGHYPSADPADPGRRRTWKQTFGYGSATSCSGLWTICGYSFCWRLSAYSEESTSGKPCGSALLRDMHWTAYCCEHAASNDCANAALHLIFVRDLCRLRTSGLLQAGVVSIAAYAGQLLPPVALLPPCVSLQGFQQQRPSGRVQNRSGKGLRGSASSLSQRCMVLALAAVPLLLCPPGYSTAFERKGLSIGVACHAETIVQLMRGPRADPFLVA